MSKLYQIEKLTADLERAKATHHLLRVFALVFALALVKFF